MTILQKLADPAIMEQMTTGERLSASLYVTILGMGITFIALLVIWVAINFMTKMLYKPNNTSGVKVVPSSKAPVKEVSAPAVKQDDHELIAVLTAAIAAATGQSPKTIIVRDYKRITSNANAWSQAGMIENLNNRVN